MKLRALLRERPDVEIRGSRDIEITGITSHSKQVCPGNVFVVKRGLRVDGSIFVQDAINAGARAILTDLYNPLLKNSTQIIVPDVAELEAYILRQFYQQPDQDLFMVGVTGTKGKTTTTMLIRHLLEAFEGENLCGLLGTIEYRVGAHRYEATHTTPDISYTFRLLREMVRAGSSSCVMEVSSHALDQGRTRGVEYDCAVFTNLTHEHLDYHKTMEAYAQSKAQLFSSLSQHRAKTFEKVAIINKDDPWAPQMIAAAGTTRVVTFSVQGTADIYAEDIVLKPTSSQFSLCFFGRRLFCALPMTGTFNIQNALAAFAVAYQRHGDPEKIVRALQTFPGVRGRLELVPHPYAQHLGISVFVDYAHAPDALEQVLKTVRSCALGRVLLVFGCGGNRDWEKRPIMARAAEKYADYIVVTSDNPRNEDPLAIIQEIIAGFTIRAQVSIRENRRDAIYEAIRQARRDDVVLIAGKGHETKQQFAFHSIDFDDRVVASEALDAVSDEAMGRVL